MYHLLTKIKLLKINVPLLTSCTSEVTYVLRNAWASQLITVKRTTTKGLGLQWILWYSFEIRNLTGLCRADPLEIAKYY